MKLCTHAYKDIISIENLLLAWKEFLKGKRGKKDVQEFEFRLMDNILSLHTSLKNKTYRHGGYYAFNISDPKPRNIHKALVRDRLLHHAIYRILYSYFDKRFITHSYSCRKNKGTHRAIKKFQSFAYKESQNHTKTVWVLKCDIRKFFASIDQKILIEIVEKYINDKEIIWLLLQVISSFSSTLIGKGLPLGNLTSQLLVNIYMNEFDQFMKHILKTKYYIRYADDFIIINRDRDTILEIIPKISDYLEERLKLSLHPDKLFIKTFASGMDFLGWVNFPDHIVIRTTTKKRVIKAFSKNAKKEVITSYLGLLEYGNTYTLKVKIHLFLNANKIDNLIG